MKRTHLLAAIAIFLISHVDAGPASYTLSFQENKGQVCDQLSNPRPDILFSGKSSELIFHLRNNGISYQVSNAGHWKKSDLPVVPRHQLNNGSCKPASEIKIYRVDVDWMDANPGAGIIREQALPWYDNFYSEVCPNGVTHVQSYTGITYKNIYGGIDLKWYGVNGNLKYDYLVAPGADYTRIRMQVRGAENIEVNSKGELIIQTPMNILVEKPPLVTQFGRILKAKWIVNGDVVSFDISGADKKKPMVIDPLVRLWGTYYGDTDYDEFYGSTTDGSGNLYVSGYSNSQINIATSGAYQTSLGDMPATGLGDAVLVKFNAGGIRQWATYYGGRGEDYAERCAVNTTGNKVALVGTTTSTLAGVIATPGSHQPVYGGNANLPPGYQQFKGDAFLAVFDDNGIRQWGTYYGGNLDEWAGGCVFDAGGDIYMSGISSTTVGTSVATPGSHQPVFGGAAWDGYLVKFTGTGTRLWGTYYGGSGWDAILSCTLDNSGNVYVTGWSESKNAISTPGAFQPVLNGPYFYDDGIVVKFNSSGARQWGTYFGGSGLDEGLGCASDAVGNVYVSGRVTAPGGTSITFTTAGAYQTSYGGGAHDGVLMKFSSSGARLWGTYYGGNGDDSWNRCSIDPSGNIYLTGITSSTNAIATPCAMQENFGGGDNDSYLAKFDANGSRYWGTYYGGTASENYCTVTCDPSGNVYLAGSTGLAGGTVMASADAHQANYGGGDADGFIAKFDGCIPSAPNTTDPANMVICDSGSTALTTSLVCGARWYDAPAGGTAIGNNSLFITPTLSTTTAFYVSDESCGSTTVRTAITVSVGTSPVISVSAPHLMLCASSNVDLAASGGTSYTWTPAQGVSCLTCANTVVSPEQTTEFCVTGTNDNYCFASACSTIEVNSASGYEFSFPSAFTPNGDGINDSFCLQGWDVCNDKFLIRIFDRWGEKVFESTDPGFCWDGIYKGQLLNADVFAYSVNASYKDDTMVNKKGNITLIR